MYEDKRFLTANEIYAKEFKIDARGFRPQEVITRHVLDYLVVAVFVFVSIINTIVEDGGRIIINTCSSCHSFR